MQEINKQAIDKEKYPLAYEIQRELLKQANYGWTLNNTSKIPNELPIAENIAGRLVGKQEVYE